MDTRYYWTLCRPPDKQLIDSVGDGAEFYLHMERAFGKLPVDLDEKHIERLEGMAATWTHQSVPPYVLLIRAIHRHKQIRIWSESE